MYSIPLYLQALAAEIASRYNEMVASTETAVQALSLYIEEKLSQKVSCSTIHVPRHLCYSLVTSHHLTVVSPPLNLHLCFHHSITNKTCFKSKQKTPSDTQPCSLPCAMADAVGDSCDEGDSTGCGYGGEKQVMNT